VEDYFTCLVEISRHLSNPRKSREAISFMTKFKDDIGFLPLQLPFGPTPANKAEGIFNFKGAKESIPPA